MTAGDILLAWMILAFPIALIWSFADDFIEGWKFYRPHERPWWKFWCRS